MLQILATTSVSSAIMALPLLIMSCIMGIFALCFLVLILKCFKKVPPGKAIIKTGLGSAQVSFTGIWVLPVHHASQIDTSAQRLDITQSPLTKDGILAEISSVFILKIARTQRDVLSVVNSIGTERISDKKALLELFESKFSEAFKVTCQNFSLEELNTKRFEFKEQVCSLIGTDLLGFILEDFSIDRVEKSI